MEKLKLKLNTDKLKKEMKRLKVNRTWLAKQLKVSPGMITYVFDNKPFSYAVKLAPIFDMEPKDLII